MVADGYKDTEIGVIPIEWKVKYIKDIAKIKTGKKDTQDKEEGGEYPFFVRSQTIERISSYSFDGEAVLTAGDGVGVGKIYHYLNEKFDYHQRVYNIHNFSDDVSGRYFFEYFKATFYSRVSRMSAKNSVDSVRLDMIAKMEIPLPPLKEQEIIADILSTADNKIDAIASQIKKAETLKKGLLQKLLSEGIGHSEFKDSELGKIPESWKVGKLEDILTIKYGKSQKDVEDINGEYPILGTGGIMGYANNYLCNKPSVLIGRKGTIDKPQYMETPFWTVDTLFYTELKKDIYPKFVYYIFQTIPWKKYNEASGVPSLSKPNIHNIATVLLSIEEQKQIADILSTADEKLEVLRAKKEKYETLKKGLLQKLLSGEVRV